MYSTPLKVYIAVVRNFSQVNLLHARNGYQVQPEQLSNTNSTAILASLILQVVFPTSGVVELVGSMFASWRFEFLRDGDPTKADP
jgi:hypothetical protein